MKLSGKIFKDITGHDVTEFKTTSEVWDAVVKARPTVKELGKKIYKIV